MSTGPTLELLTPRSDLPSAAYVVGHGPLREPRLVELQYQRIRRQALALGQQLGQRFHLQRTFVDLNFDRTYKPEELPAFEELYEAVSARAYRTVFIDVDYSAHRSHRLSFVPHLLRSAGADVYNAATDDGGALRSMLTAQYGERVGRWAPFPHTTDLIGYFPALVGNLVHDVWSVVEPEDGSNEPINPNRMRVWIDRLLHDNPYRAGDFPLLGKVQYQWLSKLLSTLGSIAQPGPSPSSDG